MPSAAKLSAAADRLRLVQLLSPAFPVGGYAYSQGLEQAMVDGAVHDNTSLAQWIAAVLRAGAGRMDGIFLAQMQAGGDVDALRDLAYAYAPSRQRHTEMRDQGAAFGPLAARIIGVPQPDLPYALAVGYAARGMAIDTSEVVALWLHALAAQMISAAVRFLPLGASDGQAVLSGLSPLILDIAEDCAAAGLDDLTSASFGADIAAMRHETLEVRIFKS